LTASDNHDDPKLIAIQQEREDAYIDRLMGRWREDIRQGDISKSHEVKSIINRAVPETATRWKAFCKAVIEGDTSHAKTLLKTSTFGPIQVQNDYGRTLGPILGWYLEGSSPGRIGEAEGETTFAEDTILACLAWLIHSLVIADINQSKAVYDKKYQGKSLTLINCLRQIEQIIEVVLIGQWISKYQGPKAMKRVAGDLVSAGRNSSWLRRSKLHTTATLLSEKVFPHLRAYREIGGPLEPGEKWDRVEQINSKRIAISVMDNETDLMRRIEMGLPTTAHMKALDLLVVGDSNAAMSPLSGVALAMLCCINAEFGWFEIRKEKRGKVNSRTKRQNKVSCLVLTQEATTQLTENLDMFKNRITQSEPMLCKPVNGGYLSDSAHKVTNKNTVTGAGTDIEGTLHWKYACKMAETSWVVDPRVLDSIRTLRRTQPSQLNYENALTTGAASSLVGKTFYLPIQCDFRGRTYYRTSQVTPQGSDLKKSLICFPPRTASGKGIVEKWAREEALAIHMSNLAGIDGIDKASLKERLKWWNDFRYSHRDFDWTRLSTSINCFDKPLQFLAHYTLFRGGRENQIPIQIDGTCNGLQHLSAMFGDEDLAHLVNIYDSNEPGDVYKHVAFIASNLLKLESCKHSWVSRVSQVDIDRDFVKRCVMTLPYGVTRQGMEDQIISKYAAQVELNAPLKQAYLECLHKDSNGNWSPDSEAVEAGYLAYTNRTDDISKHPLLRMDARKVTGLVWKAIEETLPVAVRAMESFRAIGKMAGPYILEWDTGLMSVRQSKAKHASKQLRFKGLHMPDIAKRLSLSVKQDEIDKASHSSGIIANFIHSQDAAHLVNTLEHMPEGAPLAACHDSFWTNLDHIGELNRQCRRTFYNMYSHKVHYGGWAMTRPIRLIDPKSGDVVEEWASLYEAAAAASCEFPEYGQLDLDRVKQSRWFFH